MKAPLFLAPLLLQIWSATANAQSTEASGPDPSRSEKVEEGAFDDAAGASVKPTMDASTTASPSGSAQELFMRGRESWKAQRYEEACALFAQSHVERPSPATLLNLGLCREQEGDIKGARDTYLATIEEAKAHSNREKANLWIDAANERLEALPLEEPAAPVQNSSLPEATASRSAPSARAQKKAGSQADPPPDLYRPKPTPWILVSTGAALGAGSLVTGMMTAHANRKLAEACTLEASAGKKGCPEKMRPTHERAENLSTVTDALWISGALLATSGLVWLFVENKTTSRDAKAGAKTTRRETTGRRPLFGLACATHGCSARVTGHF